jgi:hypothetical protein
VASGLLARLARRRFSDGLGCPLSRRWLRRGRGLAGYPQAFVQRFLQFLRAQRPAQVGEAGTLAEIARLRAQQDAEHTESADESVDGIDGGKQQIRHQPPDNLSEERGAAHRVSQRGEYPRNGMPDRAGYLG